MQDYAVTVTGATGKTGREVVAQALVRGWRVRAAARRRPAAGEWVRLDWDDETTWRPAFAGSDAAYVLIPFNHPAGPARTPALLQAAAAAGVGRVVLLTSWDSQHAPADSPLRVAEATLTALPVRAAVLRPTWFLDNFTTGSFATMTAEGRLRLPAGDGRVPFIDARDVAAVAVAALADNGPEGSLHLTGPEALDHHEVAAALGRALNRPVRYESVGADEFVALLAACGFAEDYGRFLADALTDVAAGRLQIGVTDTVERAVGRPPYTVDEFAAHHAAG